MLVKDRRLTFIGLRPTGDFADLTAYTTKRGKVVWFPKSPPLKPPSIRQLRQRQLFRNVGKAWQTIDQSKRNDWNNAARRSHIFLSGYLLFLVWTLRPNRPSIRTIERLSGITLISN